MSNINDTRRTAILRTMGMGLGSEVIRAACRIPLGPYTYGNLLADSDITAKTTRLRACCFWGELH